MKILALSTAEQSCSLAVIDNDVLVYEERWSSRQTHSKRVLQMIEHGLVNRADIRLEDIDAFIAAQGPGSFTGMRIGISVIQGLAFSTGTPALGVSSLDGIAFRFSHVTHPVCAMMDARRNEVYCAVYQFNNGALVSKSREKVLEPEAAVLMAGPTAFYAGSGSKVYQSVIEKNAQHCQLSHPFADSVNAATLVQVLSCKGDFLRDHEKYTLTPSYIRKSDAELQFIEKKG